MGRIKGRSHKDSTTSDIRVKNRDMNFKREIISVAASEGYSSYGQWVKRILKKEIATFPENARKYNKFDDDDGC